MKNSLIFNKSVTFGFSNKYSEMKKRNVSRARRMITMVLIMGATLSIMPTLAQFVPQQVSATNMVVDQWDRPLLRANGGDYIQILYYNGQILPPAPDGSPHTNNPIAYEAHIGWGVVADTSTVGRFSVGVTPYPTGPIFTRAWNTPTSTSYYADSQVFTPNEGEVFYPVFGPMIAMDANDNDNDGLNNSDEFDLGSNPGSSDSDGDGVFDFAEFRSGTELTNDLSYLAMVEILPNTNDQDVVQVQWSAVDGYTYQLQYTVQDLTDPSVLFMDINNPVTATGEVASAFVTNSLLEEIKSFRVLLVE